MQTDFQFITTPSGRVLPRPVGLNKVIDPDFIEFEDLDGELN